MPSTDTPAGTVRLIHRFPVKGMAGEQLAEVFVTYAGLTGDRVYAFLDPENKTDFPWITPRIWPGMLLLKPKFLAPPRVEEERPARESYRVEVAMPDGSSQDVTAESLRLLLETKSGKRAILRFSERSMHDARPVSIFGGKTLDALSDESGIALDPRRFRPNFVVDWTSPDPFYEDSLIDRRIRIGQTLTLVVAKRNQRCKVVTFDPDTIAPSPQIFENIARRHDSCVGIYGAVLREGIVRRGDPVFVD